MNGMNSGYGRRCRGEDASGPRRAPSSFRMQTPEIVFDHLALRKGMVFLDAGCGAGDYARRAARLLGEQGRVIALDSVESSVEELLEDKPQNGSARITGLVCDITAPLPLEAQSVDVILLSTVLHIPNVRGRVREMCGEFQRVLRPGGVLAVLETRKEAENVGPPAHLRLSVDDVEALTAPCGFQKESELAMERTWLAVFRPTPAHGLPGS